MVALALANVVDPAHPTFTCTCCVPRQPLGRPKWIEKRPLRTRTRACVVEEPHDARAARRPVKAAAVLPAIAIPCRREAVTVPSRSLSGAGRGSLAS